MKTMRPKCGDGRGRTDEGNEVIAGPMRVAGSVTTGELVIRQENTQSL